MTLWNFSVMAKDNKVSYEKDVKKAERWKEIDEVPKKYEANLTFWGIRYIFIRWMKKIPKKCFMKSCLTTSLVSHETLITFSKLSKWKSPEFSWKL